MSMTSDLMGSGIPAAPAVLLGNHTVTDNPTRSVSTALTAAGTVLSDALALVSLINVVATCGAGAGVKLPEAPIGSIVMVQNNGANACLVYPPTSSGSMNGDTAGDAVSVAAAAGGIFSKLSATAWLATVTAKSTAT